MKHIKFAALAALVVSASLVIAAIPSANDVNYKTMSLGAANGSCVVATHAATNLNLPIDMTRQSSLAMLYQFIPISTATDAVNTCSALLSPSLDGTIANADLNQTYIMTGTANLATNINVMTNLNGGAYSGFSGIGGYRYLVLRYITNGTQAQVTNWFIVPYKHGLSGNP